MLSEHLVEFRMQATVMSFCESLMGMSVQCGCEDEDCEVCQEHMNQQDTDHFLHSVKLYSSGWNHDFISVSSEHDDGTAGADSQRPAENV